MFPGTMPNFSDGRLADKEEMYGEKEDLIRRGLILIQDDEGKGFALFGR